MKKFIALLCALTLCLSFSVTAFADTAVLAPVEIPGESTVEPTAEEQEWVFRIHDGNLEKRLWSNTYGKWLTDWLYVCPASVVQ